MERAPSGGKCSVRRGEDRSHTKGEKIKSECKEKQKPEHSTASKLDDSKKEGYCETSYEWDGENIAS